MTNPRPSSLLLTLSLAVWLAGCAGGLPQPFANDPSGKFARFALQLDRLNDVAMPLLVEAANLCKNQVHGSYGFVLHDKSQYKKLLKGEDLNAVIQHYGLQRGIKVRYVHPKLSAGAAGLHSQEVVISIEGESLVDKTVDDANEIMHRLERRKEGPLHMVVEGIDGVRELDLYSLPACDYPIMLVESDLVNAFADGTRIVITTAMLDFCANETELALVIGHEIAHNVLGHADDVRLRRVLDALSTARSGYRAELAATATQFSFSRDFESAADYVGLYLAARAEHDIHRGGSFWMRLSRQRTSVTTRAFAITHPSFPERFTSFQATLREIEMKKKRGEPLLPTRTLARPTRS